MLGKIWHPLLCDDKVRFQFYHFIAHLLNKLLFHLKYFPGKYKKNLQIRARDWKLISYLSIKTYVVGTQKNRLKYPILFDSG